MQGFKRMELPGQAARGIASETITKHAPAVRVIARMAPLPSPGVRHGVAVTQAGVPVLEQRGKWSIARVSEGMRHARSSTGAGA